MAYRNYHPANGFFVSKDGNGDFITITAASNACINAGLTGVSIFIHDGVYTENPPLAPGCDYIAFTADASEPNVTIIGNCTFSSAGTTSISGIRLQTNSATLLAVTGSAASVVNLNNCYLNATNNNAITFSSSSASATINLNDCFGNLGSNTSFFAHTSAGILNFNYTTLSNGGASTTQSTCSSGFIVFRSSSIGFAITTSSTGSITANYTSFNCQSINTTALTCGGGASIILNSDFAGGSASVLSISGTLGLVNCAINSTNTNAITGGGNLNYSGIYFSGTSSKINVTTQVSLVTSRGAVKVTIPGAYPYTMLSSDDVIPVDSSSARTINLVASPATGQLISIKDNAGLAATNNITISPAAGNIDGSSSFIINSNYGSVELCYNGTQWNIL